MVILKKLITKNSNDNFSKHIVNVDNYRKTSLPGWAAREFALAALLSGKCVVVACVVNKRPDTH
jgi:hypothetical protein